MSDRDIGPLERARQAIGGVVQKAFPKKRISNRYQNYVVLLATFAIYLTVCTVFYMHYENWKPSVALSFIVQTMTTVGKHSLSFIIYLSFYNVITGILF